MKYLKWNITQTWKTNSLIYTNTFPKSLKYKRLQTFVVISVIYSVSFGFLSVNIWIPKERGERDISKLKKTNS